MDHFELVSQYKPTGDQPQAIEDLVKGFKEGNQCQTLLGVTGSGKTFTMANVEPEPMMSGRANNACAANGTNCNAFTFGHMIGPPAENA